MVILVTGCAGFIGSHLVDLLLAKGFKVLGIDNLSNGSRSNLESAFKNNAFSFINMDLIDTERVNDLFKENKIVAVYHLAARGSVPASLADPTATFVNNAGVSHELMITATRHGVERFIYASSSSVYGESKADIKEETLPCEPINPYGISKLVVEKYAQTFYKHYKLRTCGMRFFNVYGPRQKIDMQYGAVIPNFIAATLRNQPLSLNGDGYAIRDFTFVHDVCQALYRVLMTPPTFWEGEVYNVCTYTGSTLRDLIAHLRELIDPKEFEVLQNPKRKGDIDKSIGSNVKLANDLGYKPTTSLKDGLMETIEWYSKRVGL